MAACHFAKYNEYTDSRYHSLDKNVFWQNSDEFIRTQCIVVGCEDPGPNPYRPQEKSSAYNILFQFNF